VSSLDNAAGWQPGCVAIAPNGCEWVAAGGNDYDGATAWEQRRDSHNLQGAIIMKKVTIKFCYGDYKTLVSNHKTDDDDTAIERAISKHFGVNAGFFIDNGISTNQNQYGQIGHHVKSENFSTMDTGRLLITVD